MTIRQRWKVAMVSGPVVAVVLVLAFFIITDRWTQLDNPLAAIIATVAGVLGLVVSIGVERLTRKKPAQATGSE